MVDVANLEVLEESAPPALFHRHGSLLLQLASRKLNPSPASSAPLFDPRHPGVPKKSPRCVLCFEKRTQVTGSVSALAFSIVVQTRQKGDRHHCQTRRQ